MVLQSNLKAKYQPEGKNCAALTSAGFGRTRCCKTDILKDLKALSMPLSVHQDSKGIIQIPRAQLFHGAFLDFPTQDSTDECI
ncbi:hypothetical protein MJO29_013896 [Puccinia striiformis f. sp. tritici]|nr:hypothetical protein MJO29_013896 [Puccinia striiformis f. sp. tritici]